MNVKKHCDLCQHQVLSLKKGSICSKTKVYKNMSRKNV
jgi:hypothetical protein